MSESQTVTRSRQNTRSRLFEAASLVFAEQGVGATSVEAICERAGFTRGAFYSNFESKEDLFLELIWQICEAKLAEVGERVRAIPETKGDVALPDLIRRLVEVATDQPGAVMLMNELRAQALRDERMAQAYLEWQDRMAERVALLIEDISRRTGLAARVPFIEFARLILIVWDGTETQAIMRKMPMRTASRLMTDRTIVLAEALVYLPES